MFAGLGGIGQRHLRNLCAVINEKIEIIAFRERKLDFSLDNKLDIERGVSLEGKYNITVYDDLRKALSQNPQMAFITNPTSKHLSVALEIANANCDFFIEKPLSHNQDNLEDLSRIVSERSIIAFVGYQNRYHPCIKKTKELLQQGRIGDVMAVNIEIGEYLPGWHKYEDYRSMYAAKSDLGGGVILSQIHEFDYLYYFWGMPKSVYTIGGKFSDLEIDVEDTASTMMEYDMEHYRFPVHVHQDYLQNPPARTCKIIGKNGKICFDLIYNKLELYGENGNKEIDLEYDSFERNDMFIEEIQSFLKSVKDRTEPEISIKDGIASMRIALSAKESMVTKNIVFL